MKYAEVITVDEERVLVRVPVASRVELVVQAGRVRRATTTLEHRGTEWLVTEATGSSQIDTPRLREAIEEAQKIALRRV